MPGATTEPGWVLAADVGGTFTDVLLADAGGRAHSVKVSSTHPDPHVGVIAGVRRLIADQQVDPAAVAFVLYATTAGTNAILERSGPLTGLITTEGFRDVLELRRMRVPDLYNLDWDKPSPVVERALRLGVVERIAADGSVVTPLDEEGLERALERLRREGVATLAVCFINAHANPTHERRAREVVSRVAPELPVSLSSDVLPDLGEYERTSTTVINALLTPVISRDLDALGAGLAALGVHGALLVMQSNGGLAPREQAVALPVNLVESGPAAGVIAAGALGLPSVISFDMGGTTAKASLIEGGELLRAAELEVGAPISIASLLLRGGGYVVRTPAIHLAEVGAGGGSVAHLDPAGGLHVGPRSAGSVPGPACYARGGTEPTVTDANVVLGYLNPDALLGGELPIDRAQAVAAVETIASPLGLSVEAAAHAVHAIAVATMMRAIRAVSTERGRDVRDSVLVAFGGNGGVFAAVLARELKVRRCLVPPAAGLYSSTGLLRADLERHFVRCLPEPASATVMGRLEEFERVSREALPEYATWRRVLDLRYQGQGFQIRVALHDADTIEDAVERFHVEHERTYGFRSDDPVVVWNLRLEARVPSERPPTRFNAAGEARECRRRAYFGPALGWLDTPVLSSRSGLVAGPVEGPLIVEEYDTTIVVPPGFRVRLENRDDVVIEAA
jgi:N-methylhydantoinase A